MNLSRFSHFNDAKFPGTTNNDDSENKHLKNGAMIITGGICFRSRYPVADNSELTGSFVTVKVDQEGSFSDLKSIFVRPNDDHRSSVNVVPFTKRSLLAQENDNTGHVTFQMKNGNRKIKEINRYYESSEPSITLPIGDPNGYYFDDPSIDYSAEWGRSESVCSQCIIL